MKTRFGATSPGSARVSRAGCGVPPQEFFLQQSIPKEVRDREDAITNTRGPSRTGVVCATQSYFCRCTKDPI
jgi:hypothetical protein